jgi:hypothetical protein
MGLLNRPGLRLAIEAVAIVLAALVTGLLHLDAWGIAAAVAVVWVAAAIIEYSLGHRNQGRRRPARPQRAPEPEPEREPAPTQEPEAAPLASEGVRVIRRVQPEPVAVQPAAAPPAAPEPAPPEPVVEAEPEPTPEPEPEPEPQPEPEPAPPAPVPAAAIPAEPRRWSIWDLERALREGTGASEEAEFMLLYLRDFADAEGLLPIDFDGLVRESFGDALAAVA